MASVSKTISPLHFEDLEPHRFEDMVRQLVYDWRAWISIEAVGRLGSDEGIDIRATEQSGQSVAVKALVGEEDVADLGSDEELPEQRVWIMQCKRERQVGPSALVRIVQNDLAQQEVLPYGYIVVAACDFSKRARDAFREKVVKFAIEEFYLWGKAELEDMLFQPSHDHLLFAYFGISLQVRRRSIKTAVRANITLKRQLSKVLGGVRDRSLTRVLIRDPRNLDYPHIDEGHIADFYKNPTWRYWEFSSFHPQNILQFVKREYLAFIDWSTGEWDAFLDADQAWPPHPELYGITHKIRWDLNEDAMERYHQWREHIPTDNRAELIEIASIPFERIIAVDEMGDIAHAGPHLLVEYRQNDSPFEDYTIRIVRSERGKEKSEILADESKRIRYFVGEPPVSKKE